MHPGAFILENRIRADVRHGIVNGPASKEQILMHEIMAPIIALMLGGVFVPFYAARTFMERKEKPLLAVFAHLLMLPVGYAWFWFLDLASASQELIAQPWLIVTGAAIGLWLTGLVLYDAINGLYDSFEKEERARMGLSENGS